MNKLLVFIACVALAGCVRGPGEVADKVLTDFGIKKQPEGHVSDSDRVFKQLDTIGPVEMKRLNLAQGENTVKFQNDGLRGMYYKEKKVYESYYPLETSASGRSGDASEGFSGYIEFNYRVYQSARVSTRTEALSMDTDIPTDTTGSDVFRYRLNATGVWDGAKGQKAKKE